MRRAFVKGWREDVKEENFQHALRTTTREHYLLDGLF